MDVQMACQMIFFFHLPGEWFLPVNKIKSANVRV